MGVEDREVKKDFVPQEQIEEEILPSKFEALPPLKEGYTRLVHITDPESVEKIVANGFYYGDPSRGMVSSMTRGFNRAEDFVYEASKDDRYNFSGAKAVIMDVPQDEARLHNNPAKAPGTIPAKYIVGVINANPEDRGFRVYKRVKGEDGYTLKDEREVPPKREELAKSIEVPNADTVVSKEDEIW